MGLTVFLGLSEVLNHVVLVRAPLLMIQELRFQNLMREVEATRKDCWHLALLCQLLQVVDPALVHMNQETQVPKIEE